MAEILYFSDTKQCKPRSQCNFIFFLFLQTFPFILLPSTTYRMEHILLKNPGNKLLFFNFVIETEWYSELQLQFYSTSICILLVLNWTYDRTNRKMERRKKKFELDKTVEFIQHAESVKMTKTKRMDTYKKLFFLHKFNLHHAQHLAETNKRSAKNDNKKWRKWYQINICLLKSD